MSLKELPEKLQPYVFLGLDLQFTGGKNVTTDCPFCGREGKFVVNSEDGRARCFVCNIGESEKGATSGMNIYSFMRLLYKHSLEDTDDSDYKDLATDRSILKPQTIKDWGLAVSKLTDEWLVPGYDMHGKLMTLYVYRFLSGAEPKGRLMVVPGTKHQLAGMNLYTAKKQNVWFCEGLWDAMTLYEAMRYTKHIVTDERDIMSFTSDISKSLLQQASVLAVPGATTFNEQWAELCGGKKVHLIYDSDHPRRNKQTGKIDPPVGCEAIKRVANVLATATNPPEEIHCVVWGEEGYDPKRESGYDLKDYFSEGENGNRLNHEDSGMGRIQRFDNLRRNLVRPIPADWLPGRSPDAVSQGRPDIDPIPCTEYAVLEEAVKGYLTMTYDHHKALISILGMVVSTNTIGDQLWIRLIGPPSCGKTELCDLISHARKYVLPKSNIRGFYSGYKSDADGKEDNSLAHECKDKTLVTKDGDTILQSDGRARILAEARDLYDRTSQAHYRNKVNRDYKNLNITWLLSGTPSLRELDTSELGERFITVYINQPDDDLLDQILDRKGEEYADIKATPSLDSKTCVSPTKAKAMGLAVGYINYLRENAVVLLEEFNLSKEARDAIKPLAKFVAPMRTRDSAKQSEMATQELPTRLFMQFIRLATMVGVVMNKKHVDEEVLDIVRHIAIDTAEGRVLSVCRALYKAKRNVGLDINGIALCTGEADSSCRKLVKFMKRIKVVEPVIAGKTRVGGHVRFRLTEKIHNLMRTVLYKK